MGLLPVVMGVQPAVAVSTPKIVVLGGSGFVGSRICERLVKDSASVVSISRTGQPSKGACAWGDKVQWVKGDARSMDLKSVFDGADAVVSSIGAIGTGDDASTNGLTVERAVSASTAAGVSRFILVSASPMVREAGLGSVFPSYIEGKQRAEAAVKSFGGPTLVLQPTFIFGGEEFSATPPRVAEWYGQQVESLLGTDIVRSVASLSPAALRLALLPPSAVDDVAQAAVAGALGRASGTLSTHDEIKNTALK